MGMRPGADTKPVAVAPVAQVVPAALAGTGPVRDLVVPVAVLSQDPFGELVQPCDTRVVRLRGRRATPPAARGRGSPGSLRPSPRLDADRTTREGWLPDARPQPARAGSAFHRRRRASPRAADRGARPRAGSRPREPPCTETEARSARAPSRSHSTGTALRRTGCGRRARALWAGDAPKPSLRAKPRPFGTGTPRARGPSARRPRVARIPPLSRSSAHRSEKIR